MLARCLLLCVVSLPLAGACSQESIRQATREVLAVQKEMLALPKVEEMETSVPPATRQAILKIKDSIANLTDAYMNCQPTEPGARRIQEALTTLIPSTDAKNSQYGSPLTFEVAETHDTRHLISITATIGIMCGSDSMLLIYAPLQGSWRQVLRWQAPPYEEVGGGFWSFQYRISPPDAKGEWFAVTAHVDAWCNSAWSSIEYAILRPGSPAKVLLKRSESMWWGGEDLGHCNPRCRRRAFS